MDKYTWGEGLYGTVCKNGQPFLYAEGSNSQSKQDNARLICARLNACEGQTTELLELLNKHNLSYKIEAKDFSSETIRLKGKVENLEKLCCIMYQFAGANNAPIELLDAICDGANGEDIRHLQSLSFLRF